MAKIICMLILLQFTATFSYAQVMDETRHIDTLSLKQRISVRTNAVDWLFVIPNIGAEFDIFRTNYNRWSAGINIRWRPRTTHTYVQPFKFNLFEVTLEGRQYWRERKAEPNGTLKPHSSYWDKLWSCRNQNPSHPRWIFYRGGFISYGQYTYILSGRYWGRQGDYIMAGGTWGFVRPFLGFSNGNTLDLEMGISAGVAMTNFQRLKYGKTSDCYYTDGSGKTGWKLVKMPMIHDLHVAVVYRMGNYPIQKKYRWRYDVDLNFQSRIDSTFRNRESDRYQKFINDSTYKVVAKRFKELYDSLDIIYNKEEQMRRDSLPVKRGKVKEEKTVSGMDSTQMEKHNIFMRKAKDKADRKKEEKKESKKKDKKEQAAPAVEQKPEENVEPKQEDAVEPKQEDSTEPKQEEEAVEQKPEEAATETEEGGDL